MTLYNNFTHSKNVKRLISEEANSTKVLAYITALKKLCNHLKNLLCARPLPWTLWPACLSLMWLQCANQCLTLNANMDGSLKCYTIFLDMWRGFLHCSSRHTVDYMAKENYLRLRNNVLAKLLSVQACLL
ncbi:hypothetical protein ACQJBY_064544 [Aegilops geniculata]